MVPCDQAIPGASFVCENQNNSDIPGSKTRTIFRANRECPSKTLTIESSCLHIVNFLHRADYNLEKVCGRFNLSVFHLPSFLFYSDPKLSWIRWRPDDSFLVKLLISMTHRWDATFGQTTEYTDIIIGARLESSGKADLVGIRYSEANLVHVEVINRDKYLASNGLNIVLCNQSMLVTNSLCAHGHAICEDGTCILSHHVCDGRPDCPDNSDESGCSHVCSFSDNFNGDHNCFTSCRSPECLCNELYFSCELGGCVPWSKVCNALPDCPDGEDEKICAFLDANSENYALFVGGNFIDKSLHKWKAISDYKCINGSNISQFLVDDLIPDCPEQDDEKTYYAFLKNGSRPDFFTQRVLCEEPDATTCEKNYRGVCYSRHLHCIHEEVVSPSMQISSVNTETCRNGAHLTNCMLYSCPTFFKCPAAYCIPVYTVCNGKVDCPNGEDEASCQNISCPGFLLCRYDNVCVHPHDVWSGHVKCPVSMDDQALGDIGACPDLCECLGNGIMCTKAIKPNLPKLPTGTRILVINNTQFKMDDLQWRGNLIALLHLQIRYCNISSVEWDHFRPLHFLQRLILRNNAIPSLPKRVFRSLSVVKDIDLGYNGISKLHPKIFKSVSTLQLLKLDFNKLTFIEPCTFEELRSLTVLNLSHNYLTDLGENVFCYLRLSIKELYIGGNKLNNLDKRFLKSHMQYLTRLDTTPLQMCCLVPQVLHCYPKENLFFSTCKHFLGWAFRYGAMLAGIAVLFISSGCVIWIFQRMRKGSNSKPNSRKLSPNDTLSLLLFICHGLQGIHVIILSGVDFVFNDYYALYEEKWKRHPLCILLNMLSYTSVLVTIFLALLISFGRMMACVFPLNLHSVSLTKLIMATVIHLSITTGVSYLPYSGIGNSHIREPHTAFGFGLVTPVVRHGHSLWPLLGYVFPFTTMLFVSCAFQIACIRTLLKKPRELEESSMRYSPHRRRSAVRCIVALVLPFGCHVPLLVLHAVVAADMQLPPYVSVGMPMFTLIFYSIINATLYVVITPAFIEFSSHCLRCK